MAAALGTWGARAVCAVGAAAVVSLGAWWAGDRARRWEAPSLERGGFRVMRGSGTPRAEGLWLVPVNLRCGHCQDQLRGVLAARAGHRAPQVVALVVDHDRAPAALAVADLPADQVWWDRAGTWRRRWGHRLYGEVLRFDPRGRYLGTRPPRPPGQLRLPDASGSEGR